MASINFSIGSTFSGEGFKRLQTAMGNTSKNIKQASEVTTQMVSTLGMMNSKFSQAANAIGGMMSAIATGNPLLIAMQAAMTGIALYQGHMQKKADQLKERMDALAESVRIAHEKLVESVNKETIDNYQSLIDECQSLSDEFDRLTNQAEDFVNIVNKIDAARDTGKNIEFQIRRAQAESEGASKVDLAKMDLEQTRKEGDQKIKRATENLDRAITKRIKIQDEENLINEQIKKREDHQLELNKKLEVEGKKDIKIAEQTTKLMEENREAIRKLTKQREDLIEKEKQADLEIDLEEQNMSNAKLMAKLANTRAGTNLKSAYDQETRDREAKEKAEEEAKSIKEREAKSIKEREAKAKKEREEKAIKEREEKAKTEAAKEKEKKTQEARAKEQAKAQILAELEEQERRIEEQRQRDELRKAADDRATQQIIGGGGGGDDGSYRDSSGILHLTSDGRNNALWNASNFGALGAIREGLMKYAKAGIKGSNGDLNKHMNNFIESAEFEQRFRPKDITDKEWKKRLKEYKKAGRDKAHSGIFNDISREAAQGGGGYGGGDEKSQAVEITSQDLKDIKADIAKMKSQLQNLGLK